MKPSGPGLLFAGRFLITVSISMLVMGLFNNVKFLHSEEHLERCTELHGEEKREEGDGGDQEEKRGNQKGREQATQ